MRNDDPPSGLLWRVAIVEDHVLQRSRTEELIKQQDRLVLVKSCGSLPELAAWIGSAPQRVRPHLVLLDLVVDHGSNVEPAQVAAMLRSGVRILVVSALTAHALAREVIAAGVQGVVSKRDSEQQLITATRTVLDGGEWFTSDLDVIYRSHSPQPMLSDQEKRALALYVSGLTLKVVAKELGVQPGTAKKYLERVKEKYAVVGRPVPTKLQMRREAERDGFVTSS